VLQSILSGVPSRYMGSSAQLPSKHVVGAAVGVTVGVMVGASVGGVVVGVAVGVTVGAIVGVIVGVMDGAADNVGETVGLVVGVAVNDENSFAVAASVQSPQAFGHDLLSSPISAGENPISRNPSQVRFACRMALQDTPIFVLYEESSRHKIFLGVLPSGESCTVL
jgi:hypothetical protein